MLKSYCTVRTQQRGPLLNIVMSTMFHIEYGNDYNSEVGTGPIKVKDMVEVIGLLKNIKGTAGLHVVLRSKKSDAAKNLIVSLNIASNKFVWATQIICEDKWSEEPLGRLFNSIGSLGSDQKGCVEFHTVEINITIHVMPVAPIKSNQLYEDTEFTDFKLQAADGVVAFHKNILSIQSEFFRTMLRGQWKETAEDSINMDGVAAQTLQHLKDFMYLGTIPDEGLELLLLVARRCLMDNLEAACIKKLITTVKPETYDALVEFACQNNIMKLVRAFAWIPNHVVNGICWY